MSLFPLATAAFVVGALHAFAPDHWVPFAAVARARGWSPARTARVTVACGVAHASVSAALGLLALAFGVAMLSAVGERMEGIAGVLLIAFGAAYAVWGIRAAGRKLHGDPHEHVPGREHAHGHRDDHLHDPSRLTAWSLFVIFSMDPCVAVIPLLFAAAPLGGAGILSVVVAYEAAMLVTMLALVLPARAGAGALRLPWLDRWGDAAAGGFVAATGVAVAILGW